VIGSIIYQTRIPHPFGRFTLALLFLVEIAEHHKTSRLSFITGGTLLLLLSQAAADTCKHLHLCSPSPILEAINGYAPAIP
jgi:hypothetical protein